MRRALLQTATLASILIATPALADPPPYQFGGGPAVSTTATTITPSQSTYDAQGNYVQPQAITDSSQMFLGEDGQYHCKRKNGTTGLVVGAALGGLLGNRIAGQGNRTLGTIVGAVGGGLLGRSVASGNLKCQ